MSICESLYLAVIFVIVSILIDCINTRRSKLLTEYVYDENNRLGDILLMFLPFMALFYASEFWMALLYLVPVIMFGGFLQWVMYRFRYLNNGPTMVYFMGPGSCLLAILGYFLFFHHGWLSTGGEDIPALNHSQSEVSWLSFWPYAIYTVIFFSALTNVNKPNSESTENLVVIMLLSFNILPLFTNFYWWALSIGAASFFFFITFLMKRMEGSSRGAMGMVASYFYMMAAVGSVMAYAIFY